MPTSLRIHLISRWEASGVFLVLPPPICFNILWSLPFGAPLLQPGAQESDQREDLLGTVDQRLQVRARALLPLVSADLEFFCMALEFALFPHSARRPQAETLNSACKSAGWQWVAQGVRERQQGSTLRHAELVDEISLASARADRRAGRRLGPSASVGLSELRRIFCIHRTEWNKWE